MTTPTLTDAERVRLLRECRYVGDTAWSDDKSAHRAPFLFHDA